MPARKRVHVRSTDSGPRIFVAKRMLSQDFYTKKGATKAARAVAEALEPCELFIHNRDGEISERETYPRSSDPRRTQG